MTSTFNILLSSAGHRIERLAIFRRALADLSLTGNIIATDRSRTAATMQRADVAVQVPDCRHPDFVPRMLEICQQHNIRLLVPNIDTELAIYAAARDQFFAIGAKVLVSDCETVRICQDKTETHAFLEKHNILTMRQAAIETVVQSPEGWQFPLIIKPRFGSRSDGVQTVFDLETLARIALVDASVASEEDRQQFIVQTIAAGVEHTIDVLVSGNGKAVCAVPRRRIEVRSGEVTKGVTVRHQTLEATAKQIAEQLPGALGPLNVQIFLDPATNTHGVIEINARLGGGYPLTEAAGGHFARWIIEEIAGIPSSSNDQWQAGLVMLRFHDAVFAPIDQTDVQQD